MLAEAAMEGACLAWFWKVHDQRTQPLRNYR